MKKKISAVGILVLAFAIALGMYAAKADAQYKAAPAAKGSEKDVKVDTCYKCHDQIKELHTMGKHGKVNCAKCHSGLAKHVANPGPDTRPVTDTSWMAEMPGPDNGYGMWHPGQDTISNGPLPV